MKYTFTNGTEEQKSLWREAASHLLNMPAAQIPLDITVTFEDPVAVGGQGHTDLAITTITYDSSESETKVRNDAPGFGSQRPSLEALAAKMGLPYSGTKHFHETAVHEMGHSFFAALPHSVRLEVVKMFGATTDDLDVIANHGDPWEDRISEGIAETFKEAFLPARFRVFPNRTNRKIPYHEYPAFRKLFRGKAGFSYVYGSQDYRVDLTPYGIFLPVHKSDRDQEAFVFYEELEGFKAGWGVDMSQFKESGELPFSISKGKAT